MFTYQFKILHKFGLVLVLLLVVFGGANRIKAQETVDRLMATVGDGVTNSLITYSDLLWQLALQPNAPINPPTKESLDKALELTIQQRLIGLESERLPQAAPTKEEVDNEIRRIIRSFPSVNTFVERLRFVGFTSTDDPNFVRLIERRVAIERYLDFRFRSFVLITADDEEKFYREVFVPQFRRQNPNVIVPALDDVRASINTRLTEEQIAADIERFLEESRERAEINILSRP